MEFTAKDVNELRKQTGAGMMACKKALQETDGDMEKAAEYLREQGVAVAAKKASRIASEGVVSVYTTTDHLVGSMVEVNCESDFVGKSEVFVELCNNIAKHVAEKNPANMEELLAQTYIGDESMTVTDLVNSAIAKIGEKISVRRFTRIAQPEGRVEGYTHLGGKLGVLLEVKTGKNVNENEEFATACHDVALHVAWCSAKYTYNNEVPAEEVAHEKEILKAQALNDPKNAGKPEAIIEKMLVGKVNKFYKDVCLIDQDFVKDNSVTVKQHLDNVAAKAGTTCEIVKFEKFVMGEGLEKKNENFAEEIAKIANK